MKGSVHLAFFICVLSLCCSAFASHSKNAVKGTIKDAFPLVEAVDERDVPAKTIINWEKGLIKFNVRPSDDYFKRNHLIYMELNGNLNKEDLLAKKEENAEKDHLYLKRGGYLVERVFRNFFLNKVNKKDFLKTYDKLLSYANEEAFGYYLTPPKYNKLMADFLEKMPYPSSKRTAEAREFREKEQELAFAIITNYYIHHGYKTNPTPKKKDRYSFEIEQVFRDIRKVSFILPCMMDIQKKGVILLNNIAIDYFLRNEAYLRYSHKLTEDYGKAVASYHQDAFSFEQGSPSLERLLQAGDEQQEFNSAKYRNIMEKAISFYNAIPQEKRPGTNVLQRPIYQLHDVMDTYRQEVLQAKNITNPNSEEEKFYKTFKALNEKVIKSYDSFYTKDQNFEAMIDILDRTSKFSTKLVLPDKHSPYKHLFHSFKRALISADKALIAKESFPLVLAINETTVQDKLEAFLSEDLPSAQKAETSPALTKFHKIKEEMEILHADLLKKANSLDDSESPYTRFYLIFYAKVKALGLDYTWNQVLNDMKELVFETPFDQLKQEVVLEYGNLMFPLIKDPQEYITSGKLTHLLNTNNFVSKRLRNHVFERYLAIHSEYFVDGKASKDLYAMLPDVETKADEPDYSYQAIVRKLIDIYNIEDGTFEFLHNTIGPGM